jgi:Ca2+-binding RTX toxin-like protein
LPSAGVTLTQGQIAGLALSSGDGNHVFVGYGTNDTISGDLAPGTSDWINAGAGNDVVNGLGGDDTLFGGAGADQVNGGSGDDLLVGGAGNDTLAGGTGNDSLTGGAGSDTYVFGLGGGHDVISEPLFALTSAELDSGDGPIYAVSDGDTPQNGDNDVLRFDAGVSESDVHATRSGDDLVLTIGSTGDSVQVQSYFANGVPTIEQVQFASGVSWAASVIRTKVLVPTAGDDEITGYLGGDRLNGLGGNDRLDGREGNDTLNGGNGNDTLTGGAGADRFVFDTAPNAATNQDTITDFQPGVDTIVLSASVFAGLGAPGSRITLSDHLLYDQTTGVLAYDADGAGGAAPVTIALLGTTSHPDSLGADFLLAA